MHRIGASISRRAVSAPAVTSHSRMVLSQEPEARQNELGTLFLEDLPDRSVGLFGMGMRLGPGDAFVHEPARTGEMERPKRGLSVTTWQCLTAPPDPRTIDRTAPLRLAVAAELAFPFGGMTAAGLRKEAARGNLAIERIAGKGFHDARRDRGDEGQASNQAKGARLWLRPATADRKAFWIIRDGSKQIGTGCGAADHREAERRLVIYSAQEHWPASERDLSPAAIPSPTFSTITAGRASEVARWKTGRNSWRRFLTR